MKHVNYYEFLQISPNAEAETIHRVYRYLGARYHPDNPQSGDAEAFTLLKTAYEVLSDPVSRADYDKTCRINVVQPPPLSDSIDFMDVMEGENNRRLAVMAVLYSRRRTHPANPEISLSDLETRLGFPRDYLDFTTWYLKKKNLITVGDNASFALTVEGVDYVEAERLQIPTLQKLLTDGSQSRANGNGNGHSNGNDHALIDGHAFTNGNGHATGNGHSNGYAFTNRNGHTNGNGHANDNGNGHAFTGSRSAPAELPATATLDDRRFGSEDRRDSKDRRKQEDPYVLIERRKGAPDRRSGNRDRRKNPS